MRSLASGIALGLSLASAPAIHAQTPDAAQAPVQMLCDRLIANMKGGAQLGFSGRAAAIGPVVDRAFDLPLMTRLTIGPQWNMVSASDQSALVSAIRKLTVNQYAANFTIDPKVETRGADRLVRTSLVQRKDPPVAIGYRLRQSGNGWKIIDVYYQNSISQLATRRSDFARVFQTGGAKALLKHLDDLANRAGH
jgi:phospholipid transport system substrate-binding protein